MAPHRSVLTALLPGLVGVLLAAWAAVAPAQTSVAEPELECVPLPAHLEKVAADWARPGQAIKVLGRPEGDSAVPIGTKVRLTLLPFKEVTPAVPLVVEKEKDFAGLVSVRTGKAGAYRFSATPYVWFELVSADVSGAPAGVTNSDKRLTCVGIVKNVVFDLAADTRYWLQLSQASQAVVDLLVTPAK